MFKFSIYNFNQFNMLEKLFLQNNNTNKNLVLMCIGTNSYFNDCFGVKLGDELKKLNFYVYGSTKREINGTNFMQVYNFIKNKHKNSKIIILDSVYLKGDKKPMLIYKNSPINVAGLNSKYLIGDEGILFNSFSYSKLEYINNAINLIKNMFLKLH